jgi:hypothetical protein
LKTWRPIRQHHRRLQGILARLHRPLTWSHDGTVRTIQHIVLASRYAGQSVTGAIGNITVGLAFVTDDSQLDLPALDMHKCAYVAIGEAEIAAEAT